MDDPNTPTATLIVSSTSTRCGRCRQGTLTAPTHHGRIIGYDVREPTPGCGARFTAITTDQLGPAMRLLRLVSDRPDLTTIIPAHMTIPNDAGAAEAERRLHTALDEFRTAVIAWKDAGSTDPDLHLVGERMWEAARVAADEFDAVIARLRHESAAPLCGVQVPASTARNLGADPATTCARVPNHPEAAHVDAAGDVTWVDPGPAGGGDDA